MEEAIRKIKKALPGEETGRKEIAFKEDKEAYYKTIFKEECDA